MADFVQDNVALPDPKTEQTVPVGQEARFIRGQDYNALRDASLSLRTNVKAVADDLAKTVLGSPSANTTSVTAQGSTTARTLAARFADVVNVKDFGAKGDGATDDRAAIAAAVASGAKEVFFPSGTYYVTGTAIPITSAVTLSGSGAASVLSGPGATGTFYFFDARASVTVRDLTFKSAKFGFRLSDLAAGSDVMVSGCRFSDMHRGIYGRPLINTPTSLGTIAVTDSEFSNMEAGVYTRYLSWNTALFRGVKAHDLLIRAVPSRATVEAGLRGYEIVGISVGYMTWDTVTNASISGCSFFNIANAMFDPWNSTAVTANDQETHAVQIEAERTAVTGNVIYNVTGAAPNQDVEGIMARGKVLSVVGNSLLDAGQQEAAINVKGTDEVIVADNVIKWTTKASGQIGILVQDYLGSNGPGQVTGNLVVNGSRGLTVRTLNALVANNTFDNVDVGVTYGAEFNARTFVMRGNRIRASINGLERANAYPVTTLVVEGNVVEGFTDTGIAFALPYFTYGTIRGNVVVATGSATGYPYGVVVSDNAGANPITSLEISGNTFRSIKNAGNTDGRAIFITPTGTLGRLIVARNTFEDCYRGLWLPSGTVGTLDFSYNGFHSVTGEKVYTTGATVSSTHMVDNLGIAAGVTDLTLPVGGGSVPLDASKGSAFQVRYNASYAGVALTMSAPTNAVDGQRITIWFRNTSGGAMGAVSWNAVFHLAGAAPTMPANGNQRQISFVYTSSAWFEESRSTADVGT